MKWLKQRYSTGTSRRKSKDLPIRGNRYGQFSAGSFRTGQLAMSTIPMLTEQKIRTQENSKDKEELDAKGNQSVGDVPTQNIYGFSPRIAENGSHHKGE